MRQVGVRGSRRPNVIRGIHCARDALNALCGLNALNALNALGGSDRSDRSHDRDIWDR